MVGTAGIVAVTALVSALLTGMFMHANTPATPPTLGACTEAWAQYDWSQETSPPPPPPAEPCVCADCAPCADVPPAHKPSKPWLGNPPPQFERMRFFVWDNSSHVAPFTADLINATIPVALSYINVNFSLDWNLRGADVQWVDPTADAPVAGGIPIYIVDSMPYYGCGCAELHCIQTAYNWGCDVQQILGPGMPVLVQGQPFIIVTIAGLEAALATSGENRTASQLLSYTLSYAMIGTMINWEESYFVWQQYPGDTSDFFIYVDPTAPFQYYWGNYFDDTQDYLVPPYTKPTFWEACLNNNCTAWAGPYAHGLDGVLTPLLPYDGIFSPLLEFNQTTSRFYICTWTSAEPDLLTITKSCYMVFDSFHEADMHARYIPRTLQFFAPGEQPLDGYGQPEYSEKFHASLFDAALMDQVAELAELAA